MLEESIKDFLWCNEDLLKDEPVLNHPLAGHCFVASQAFYALNGGQDTYKPVCWSTEINGEKVTHWWLENKDTGKVVDLTEEQFTENGIEIKREEGVGRGFMTTVPCNRTEKVIEEVIE